jgi:Carbamoyl-phosphate synthase L chain, ATP binding domain
VSGFESEAGAPGAPHVVVLWEWPFDEPFVSLLERRCRDRGLEFASVNADHESVVASFLAEGVSAPRLLVDRASDVMPALVSLLSRLKERGCRLLNDAGRMAWCRDKATMHLELVAAGVRVPFGVVVSSDEEQHEERLVHVATDLGSPFVIKPAEGGGGEGVVLDAEKPADVADYLQQTGFGKIILQRRVVPRTVGGERGWFRVFWVNGLVFPCWWNDITHVYRLLSPAEEASEDLGRLRGITTTIASISGIDLFTTEIAVDQDGELVVVDFVNEMPDLRPQWCAADGVPEPIVETIAAEIASLASHSAQS